MSDILKKKWRLISLCFEIVQYEMLRCHFFLFENRNDIFYGEILRLF